jgi:hypothetical protein
MWKIDRTTEILEIGMAFEEFIQDFFEWAINADSKKSYEDLLELAVSKENKIERVASTTKIKELMVALSKCPQKRLIKVYYEQLTNQYEKMIDGYLPQSPKLTKKSLTLIQEIFSYFYEDFPNSITFRKEYLPRYTGTNDLKVHIRKKYGESRKVCPYCDIQWTGHSAHTSIDHFFPKSSYPLLSIHISNLIVSCTGCNDRIKKAKLLLPMFHPYFHQPADFFTFTFNNECTVINGIDLAPDYLESNKRVVNYFEMFLLEEMYASVLYKVRDERNKIRDTVKKIYLARDPQTEQKTILGNILYEQINNCLEQIVLKRGQFELTKIKYDYFQLLKTTLFEIELEYLSDHLRIDKATEGQLYYRNQMINDPDRIA